MLNLQMDLHKEVAKEVETGCKRVMQLRKEMMFSVLLLQVIC